MDVKASREIKCHNYWNICVILNYTFFILKIYFRMPTFRSFQFILLITTKMFLNSQINTKPDFFKAEVCI